MIYCNFATSKGDKEKIFANTRENRLTRGGEGCILYMHLQKCEKGETKMNVQKIKGRMTELEITGREMADELGMDSSTYYRKMKKNGEDFSVADLYTFKKVLHLTDQEAPDFLLA